MDRRTESCLPAVANRGRRIWRWTSHGRLTFTNWRFDYEPTARLKTSNDDEPRVEERKECAWAVVGLHVQLAHYPKRLPQCLSRALS